MPAGPQALFAQVLRRLGRMADIKAIGEATVAPGAAEVVAAFLELTTSFMKI